MVKRKILISFLLVMAIISLAGCNKVNKIEKVALKQDKNNIDKLDLEVEDEKTICTIEEKSIDAEFVKIKYPQIKGLKDKEIQNSINKKLQKALKVYEDEANAIKSLLEVNYRVTKISHNLLSVLFTGEQSFENGKINVQKGINFDLTTSNEINTCNLIKDDKKVKLKVDEIMKDAAKEQGIECVTELESWMGLYFEEENLVFYFIKENQIDFEKIKVKYMDVKPYIREI